MNKFQLYILYILVSMGILVNLAPLSFAGVLAIPGAGDLSRVSA